MNAVERQRMLARYEVRAHQFDIVAARRRRRAGVSAAPAPAPALLSSTVALTCRERDVLTFISRGSSNGEISNGLQIGEETVKTHVKKILAKLSARNRAHAVAIGIQLGLIQL